LNKPKPLSTVERKNLSSDLDDLTAIMESVKLLFDRMDQATVIDVIARLKPAAKTIEKLEEVVKDGVKTMLNHKNGEVPGNLFKALLTIVPVDRLDQTALKEGSPTVHARYVRGYEDERVTFVVR
jgi:hypothetical protein